MKETIYKADPRQPYGLHDQKINELIIREESLELKFEKGFTKLEEPYLEVRGSVLIEGPDYDFCSVNILSRGGRYGGFRGEKLTLSAFVEKYPGFLLEVVDEYYGWHRLEYAGYLWMPLDPKTPKEITLTMGYFTGNIVYRTEEAE